MPKELFNQDLKTELGVSDRIALGVPGQEGCDNMLVSQFVELTKSSNVAIVTFTNGDLDDVYSYTYTHNKGTRNVEVTLYNPDWIKESTDGILKILSIDYIEIDFGGNIDSGTWTMIFKWYS